MEKKLYSNHIFEFLLFPHRLNSNNIQSSISPKSIIKASKTFSKITTKTAERHQCCCNGIFTGTFNCNCLLVIIFSSSTLEIIEVCQIFSSSIFFDRVEAEDKPVNQKNCVHQIKHIRVDTGADELCLICIITWSNSSKVIWVLLDNFSFTLSVLLGRLHSRIANYICLELNTIGLILTDISQDKLVLCASSPFAHCRARAKVQLVCLVRKCG